MVLRCAIGDDLQSTLGPKSPSAPNPNQVPISEHSKILYNLTPLSLSILIYHYSSKSWGHNRTHVCVWVCVCMCTRAHMPGLCSHTADVPSHAITFSEILSLIHPDFPKFFPVLPCQSLVLKQGPKCTAKSTHYEVRQMQVNFVQLHNFRPWILSFPE